MSKRNRFGFMAIIVFLSLAFIPADSVLSEEKDITPEVLIQKHLKALGGSEKLQSIKSWGIGGKAAFEFIQGYSGANSGGQFICVSDGSKVGIKMDFPDINYPGEYFAYDGNEVTVGYIQPGQKSPLAEFIFLHNATMKEGFLGGTLTTAWPLLHIGEKPPSMKLNKTVIDGQELYELEFGSAGKRTGEMRVFLYFDAKTFLHKRTEYRVRVSNDLTSTPGVVNSGGGATDDPGDAPTGTPRASAPVPTVMEGGPDSIYLLIEKFDDFALAGGIPLPRSYTVEYSLEGHGPSFLAKWFVQTDVYIRNKDVDQSFFIAQK